MNAIAALWAARNARERILIGGAGALALLVLVITLVVRPLQAMRAEALAEIRTYETLNARIRAAGPDFAGARRREGAPDAVIAASAAEFGLAARPIAGGGLVRVVIEDAPFDTLIRWIADLERSSGLRIARISLERRDAPGRVSVAMSLRQ